MEVESGMNGDEGEAHGNGIEGVNLFPRGLQVQTKHMLLLLTQKLVKFFLIKSTEKTGLLLVMTLC